MLITLGGYQWRKEAAIFAVPVHLEEDQGFSSFPKEPFFSTSHFQVTDPYLKALE